MPEERLVKESVIEAFIWPRDSIMLPQEWLLAPAPEVQSLNIYAGNSVGMSKQSGQSKQLPVRQQNSPTQHTPTYTVSTRIQGNLNDDFEQIAKILGVDKAAFLRACVDNFVSWNRIFLDHWKRKPEYISYIKKRLAELPSQQVKVIGGHLAELPEPALVILADELLASSQKVWKEILAIEEAYDIELVAKEDVFALPGAVATFEREDEEKFVGLNLLQVEDAIAILTGAEKKIDLKETLEEDVWTDWIELCSLSLILALKRAFEKHGPKDILNGALKHRNSSRVEISASGKLSRTGTTVKLPVSFNGGK